MRRAQEARSRETTIRTLCEIGVIPVVRCHSADAAIRVTDALVDAGLPIAEVTMTVPDAIEAIEQLARRYSASSDEGKRAIIGAGTVVDAEIARRAVKAGAEFIVSPGFVADVVDVARSAGVAVLPGALTPTEILAATRAGADLVKVFPVQSVGGAAYLRALRGPFPDVPLVPTGGVDLDNAADFIRAGAAAIGVGSELVSRELLARGDFAAIATRAERFVSAVAHARQGMSRPPASRA